MGGLLEEERKWAEKAVPGDKSYGRKRERERERKNKKEREGR